MCWKLQESPYSFTGRDIAGIQVELDLIFTCTKLHSCAIVTLVDVFVNVLDSLDRKDAFHVDVTSILPEPEAWIGNNPTIIDLMTSNLILLSSVTSPEIGV